jgi:hypothetical protein
VRRSTTSRSVYVFPRTTISSTLTCGPSAMTYVTDALVGSSLGGIRGATCTST